MGRHSTMLGAMNEAIRMQNSSVPSMLDMMKNITAVSTDVSAISALKDAFIETYYNKFSNGNKIYGSDFYPEDAELFVDDSKFYLPVATKQPEDVKEVSLGEYKYKNINSFDFSIEENRCKRISIGMNAVIIANVWKIGDDSTLYVAIPYLYAHSDMVTGKVSVTINSLTYDVQMFDPVPVENRLTLTRADISVKDSYTALAVIDGNTITSHQGHGTQLLGVVLSGNGGELLDPSIPFLSFDDKRRWVGLTCPETVGGVQYSYARYNFAYKNAPMEEEAKKVSAVRLIAPGIGDIKLVFVAYAVVD